MVRGERVGDGVGKEGRCEEHMGLRGEEREGKGALGVALHEQSMWRKMDKETGEGIKRPKRDAKKEW